LSIAQWKIFYFLFAGVEYMSLTERIKTIATENGHTFASLERELGFAQGSIRKWDTSIPSAEKLLKVAELLHVNIDWLLTGEGVLDAKTRNFDMIEPFLSETELLILEEYRAADKEKRKAILLAALGTSSPQSTADNLNE